MSIHRVNVVWTGLSGLPGVSVFYANNGSLLVTDLNAFFNAIKTLFPNNLQWQIPSSGDILDEVTGELTGGWTGGTGGTISGTGGTTAQYAAGVGAYVNWGTLTINNGRRLRGRTFLTNLIIGSYDSSGSIITASLGTIQSAANAVVTAGNLKVWHRPKNGSGGGTGTVTSATVPDQVTSLATRRR